MVLDYLAYQHAEEWNKLGFTVIDVVGNPDFAMPEGKVVSARLVAGWKYDAQIYCDVEGADPNMVAPKAIREQVADIKTYTSIDEYVKGVNADEAFKPDVQPVKQEDQPAAQEADFAPKSVDEAFL